MYKRKFEQWNWDKYNTTGRAIRIVNEKVRRQAAGKRSHFMRNGRDINVESYLRRRGITEYDVMDLEAAAEELPAGVRCFTPEPQVALEAPGLLRVHEALLRGVTRIGSVGDDAACIMSDFARPRNSSILILNLIMASFMLEDGKPAIGGRLLRKTFKRLDWYADNAEAYTALGLAFSLNRNIDSGATSILWKYLNARLGNAEHPWRQIVNSAHECLSSYGWDAYLRMQNDARHIFEERHQGTWELMATALVESLVFQEPYMFLDAALETPMGQRWYATLRDLVGTVFDVTIAAEPIHRQTLYSEQGWQHHLRSSYVIVEPLGATERVSVKRKDELRVFFPNTDVLGSVRNSQPYHELMAAFQHGLVRSGDAMIAVTGGCHKPLPVRLIIK
jgi:hypothetical protein